MATGMTISKSDLILHPVRIRIVTELAGRQFTPRQLAELLPDVPQATLYRHINLLTEGGVLEVVTEQQVNGATERSYSLAQDQGRLTPDELCNLSAEDHQRYFTIFAASLIDSFAAFIQHTDLNTLGADGMSYNRAVIYLNDAEREQFRQDVIALIGKMLANTPTSDRQRYTLASIVIPDGKDLK
jgi:DNA-binding transcriptional ArsR family regulator